MTNVRDYESSYRAFMAMDGREWLALHVALARGGRLEHPDEQQAFEDASRDRAERIARTARRSR